LADTIDPSTGSGSPRAWSRGDWPPPRRPRRRGRLFILAVLAAIVLGGGTALSYYVDALWFGSLGYADVFWRTLDIQAAVFVVFAALTFFIL
jgi:uncharacterized protein